MTHREVILAHELFHHRVHVAGAPLAVRPPVETLRLGPWRRTSVVRAAEEIAAAGFAPAWHGLVWPPELLDCLTLLAYNRGTESATLHARAWPNELPVSTDLGLESE